VTRAVSGSTVRGAGLYVALAPIDGRNEATRGPRTCAMIVEELERAGFTVQWDGAVRAENLHSRD